MPPMSIKRSLIQAIGLDVAADVKAFQAALKNHAKTVNVPAPTAHPLVESIVRQHEGQFVIDETSDPESKLPPDAALTLIDVLIEEGIIPKTKAQRVRERFNKDES